MEGYICLDENNKHLNGMTFEEGDIFNEEGKELLLYKHMEDSFRQMNALEKRVKVFAVEGHGYGRHVPDYNYEYIDQYLFKTVSFIRKLAREEIIAEALKLSEQRVERFIASFKLREDEIRLFKYKYRDDDHVLATIEYYQHGDKKAFEKLEDSLKKGIVK